MLMKKMTKGCIKKKLKYLAFVFLNAVVNGWFHMNASSLLYTSCHNNFSLPDLAFEAEALLTDISLRLFQRRQKSRHLLPGNHLHLLGDTRPVHPKCEQLKNEIYSFGKARFWRMSFDAQMIQLYTFVNL